MRFFVTSSLLLLATIGGGLATRPRPEPNPECRDTTISGDFTNDTVALEAMRKYVNDYWQSHASGLEHEYLTPEAKLFIEKLISRNDSDSPSLIQSLGYFTFRYSLYIILSEHQFGLCTLAAVVNSSATWAECGDGRQALEVIYLAKRSRASWCSAMVAESLEQGGCKKLPSVNVVGLGNCYKRGRVYDLEKALKYFGKDIPCEILDMVYYLYHSDNKIDNLVAASYISAIVELTFDVLPLYPLEKLLEIQYGLIDPKDKPCCCKRRREKFTEVCESLTNTDLSEAIEKYASTECPPEAAYLR